MIKYKAYEVQLGYQGDSILVQGKVIRKIDDEEWEEIDDFYFSVMATKDDELMAREIIKAVGHIARKDFITNTLLAGVQDKVEAHVFEYDTEP